MAAFIMWILKMLGDAFIKALVGGLAATAATAILSKVLQK
jgi:hypothetical protein